jgi:hypothetical protein
MMGDIEGDATCTNGGAALAVATDLAGGAGVAKREEEKEGEDDDDDDVAAVVAVAAVVEEDEDDDEEEARIASTSFIFFMIFSGMAPMGGTPCFPGITLTRSVHGRGRPENVRQDKTPTRCRCMSKQLFPRTSTLRYTTARRIFITAYGTMEAACSFITRGWTTTRVHECPSWARNL